MTSNSAFVWVFDSHTEAEASITEASITEASIEEIQSRDFDMKELSKKLSIVGKDYHTVGASKGSN